jgi:5'-3' exonuclease
MGIKSNFNKFLHEQCPDCFDTRPLSDFAGSCVAIDLPLYIHAFKASNGATWLNRLVGMIECLSFNGISFVCVFDGTTPVEKLNESQKRRQARERLYVARDVLVAGCATYRESGIFTPELITAYANRKNQPSFHRRLIGRTPMACDIEWVEFRIAQLSRQLYRVTTADMTNARELLTLYGHPYINAPLEAERTCARLYDAGVVDAVMSDDSDVIAYGARMMSKLSIGKGVVTVVDPKSVIKALDIDRVGFLDLCIMCGTDYNLNIPRVGVKTAFKHIKRFRTIDEIGRNLDIDITPLNHIRVRELFTNGHPDDVLEIPQTPRGPDIAALAVFSAKHNLAMPFAPY